MAPGLIARGFLLYPLGDPPHGAGHGPRVTAEGHKGAGGNGGGGKGDARLIGRQSPC
jgi:hypothetical protein